jgi:hypothetical protein
MPARIVITCPTFWTDDQALALAQRLMADALPSTVGVEVNASAKFMETILRPPNEDN